MTQPTSSTEPSEPHVASSPLVDPAGGVQIRRTGIARAWSRDAYHFLSTTSWLWLISALTLLFVLANAFFGWLYWLRPGCVANMDGTFEECFFFSIQTILTIGYGAWYPVDTYANSIAAVEAFSGLLFTAVCTGIMFAKFSRPTARVRFSRNWLWRQANGKQMFVIRLANERATSIVEAKIRVHVVLDEQTVDGAPFRRVHDLILRRDETPLFALSFTAVHTVDDDSPIHGLNLAELKTKNAMFLVSLSGTDERLMQTVFARHAYWVDDAVENMRFADVIHSDEHGAAVLDYDAFDRVVSARATPSQVS